MKNFSPVRNQKGAVLIIGLLIMVILSILGITTMQSSTLQERMAGNFEQRDVAFELAEAALRDGEAWLSAQVVMPSFSGSSARYQADSSLWNTDTTWDNAITYAGGGIGNEYTLPLYYLEFMANVDNSGNSSEKFQSAPEMPEMYRVTSRAQSNSGRSVVILQTTFLR